MIDFVTVTVAVAAPL